MSEPEPLFAFGGPLDGQFVPVLPGSIGYVAPLSWARRGESIEDMAFRAEYENLVGPRTDELRRVTYTVERVGYHDQKRCDGMLHERCGWTAKALIADGYPKDRITDALNAIAAMSSLLSLVPASSALEGEPT